MKHKTFLASLLTLFILSGCRINSASATKDSESFTSSESTSSLSESTSSEHEASSSSSSKNEEISYFVSANQTKGGNIRVSPQLAQEGETINVSVTADDNYIFKDFSSDPEVRFHTIEEGSIYSFIMPKGNVEITPNFIGYNSLSLNNLSSSLTIVDEDNVFKTKHKEGDVLNFKIKNSESNSSIDSDMVSHIYVHVGTKVYHPIIDSDGKTAVVSLTMPEKAQTVYVIYSNQKEETTGHTITLQTTNGFHFLGIQDKTKCASLDCYLLREEGYALSSLKWSYDGEEEWHDVSYDFRNGNLSALKLSFDGGFTKDVTIKAEGQYKGKKITYVNSSDVEFLKGRVGSNAYDPSDAPTTFIPGETFDFYVRPVAGKHLKQITFTGINPETPKKQSGDIYNIKFTMPENDITIQYECAENGKITIEDNIAVKSAVAKNAFYIDEPEIKILAPGEKFYVVIEANPGYIINGARLNNGELKTIESKTDWNADGYPKVNCVQFTMPETGNANITFEAGKGYDVHTETEDGISFSTSGKNTYLAGDTVKFSVNPGALYNVTSVKVVKADDENTEIDLTYDATKSKPYSFVMPAFDVRIKVTKEKQPTKTIELDFSGIDSNAISYLSLKLKKLDTSVKYKKDSVPSSVECLLDETFSATISSTDASKEVYIIAEYEDGSDKTFKPTGYNLDSYSYETTFSYSTIYANGTLKKLTFRMAEVEKSSITVIDSTDGAVSYSFKVNGKALSSIPQTLYLHQSVTITVTKKNDDDKNAYSPFINGTKAQKSGKNFKFEVTETETRIEFRKDQTYSLQVINNSTSGTFADYDEYEDMDDTYSGKTTVFSEGTKRTFEIRKNDGVRLDVLVEKDGIKDDKLSKADITYCTLALTFDGNYKITISEHQ